MPKFLEPVPRDLREAAAVDGAGASRTLVLPIIPLIMTIPVAVTFFVFQRRFVCGANEGSVKG